MTDEIHRRLDRFVDVQREIENILQTLVLNDSTIIDALAQMLGAIQQMSIRAENAQSQLATEFGNMATAIAGAREVTSNRGAPILAAADQFALENPEVGLMQHLYSFLNSPIAVDIGAHIGDVSERLLQAGYRVYAFEPYEPSFAQLRQRLGSHTSFSAQPVAIGAADAEMVLHIAGRSLGSQEADPSLYNSLVEHPLHKAVRFEASAPVTVRSLSSLASGGELPSAGGLLKIDVEGLELDVIAGMGEADFAVVLAEFWDREHPLGRAGHGWLAPIVEALKARGYHWHLVIYRVDQQGTLSFYANRPDTIATSWGNAMFFRDYALFGRALRWCETVLQPTIHP